MEGHAAILIMVWFGLVARHVPNAADRGNIGTASCRLSIITILGKDQNLETQICKRAKSINDLTTFILMNSLNFVTTISICIVPAD